MVVTESLEFSTMGKTDIVNITEEVQSKVSNSKVNCGTVTLFITGSTAGLTTVEYEPGLLADFKAFWQRIAPDNIPYEHNERWRDGNGYAHVRASFLGPSLAVPFNNKQLVLGTWQQIVVVDFDNRARKRRIILQIIGE